MSSISSLSGLTRYWGLASGLDVESIVTGLTSDIQSQIDSAKAAKTKLEWKQDAYRDIISQLNTFQSKYFSLSSSYSMISSSMYSSYSVSSSNSVLTATANADASGSAQSVTIMQSAKKASVTSASIKNNVVTGTVDITDDLDTVKDGLSGNSFTVYVDDISKSISFTDDELSSVTDADSFVDLFNEKLEDAFGTVGGNARVSATLSDGKLCLTGAEGYESTKITFDSSDASTALGLNSLSNRLSTSTNLGTFLTSSGVTVSNDTSYDDTDDDYYNFDIYINDTAITLNSSTMSVSDAITAINSAGAGVKATYNSTTDKITFESTQNGSTGEVELGTDDDSTAFFKSIGIDLSDSSSYDTVAGQDAIISVDGTNYVRSTNNFTISGVTYSITSEVDSTDPQTSTLTFTQDTDTLKTGINQFISDYNDLIGNIVTYMTTKPSTDGSSDPLTESEQEDMTQDQIDNWNDKANDSILYGDSTLSDILTTLRTAIYAPVTLSDGSTMSLYDMGITTTDNYLDYGKIEIKTGDEATFNDYIMNNTALVKDFFSQQSSILLNTNPSTTDEVTDQTTRYNNEGIMYRIDDIIKANTGFIYGNYGTLIQMAGTTTMQTYNNFLYTEIQTSASNITSIQERLQTKQDLLYNQFEALESYMSTASSQTSIISNMLGSSD